MRRTASIQRSSGTSPPLTPVVRRLRRRRTARATGLDRVTSDASVASRLSNEQPCAKTAISGCGHPRSMATRQAYRDRGRARGRLLVGKLVGELITARRTAGISQVAVAQHVGCSQSEISRLERLVSIDDVSLVRVCEIAAVLGLDVSVGLHPNGDQLRDQGHQRLIARFVARLGNGWRAAREVPFPRHGDPRSWDLVLRSAGLAATSRHQVVGVEAETRIRDVQALTRRIRERERDGGTDVVVLVLSDSAVNRRLLPELLDALGPSFSISPRALLNALKSG